DVLAAVAVAGRHLHDRRAGAAGGLVDAAQDLDLGRLGHAVGQHGDVVDAGRRGAGEGDRVGAAVALARRGRGGLGGRPQSGFAEVGGVGEAGGLALDDADAGTAVAPGGQLLDLAVVEAGGGAPLVLGVDLGELAAGAQRAGEHSFEHVVVD